ncbi:MAG: signal transduction histidine kinase [Belnapia sp.]|nr:signal transduction histidine kinase [Belnapia sp.]
MPLMQDQQGIARLLRQQAALASFGSYAFREPVLFDILTEASRICAESLAVPLCKVCEYRPEQNDLLVVAGHGWKHRIIGVVVSSADVSTPQGRCFITGQPIIIHDIRVEKGFALPEFYAQHGIISTIDVPIRGYDGTPYGILEIDSPVEHCFNEHDVQFLTGFANVLAEAVLARRKNAQIHTTMKELATIVAERGALLEERAILAEELKHRVRNNLQFVNSMLEMHLQNETDDHQRASANGIIRRVITLSEVYEQLLGTGLGRTIDLADYLRSLCKRLPELQQVPEAGIRIHCVAAKLFVNLDTVTAIGMAVAELVSNSYEHAFPTATGMIDVTLQLSGDGNTAIVVVADDGISFVEKPGSKRHGVGLVRRLVEQVRGSATLSAERGSVWTISFPVTPPVTERVWDRDPWKFPKP